MFEYKVTWSEETEVPSIYQFRTLIEAKSFHQGLIEPSQKMSGCPNIHKVERGRWEHPISDSKKNFLPSLLFSIFIGLWATVWWYLMHKGALVAIEEYLIIGSLSTLIAYLTLLVWNWFKGRK